MILDRQIAGCVFLLGNIFVVFTNSEVLQCYSGCRPYSLQKTSVILGMNPTDITTNYAGICAYVLDSGNACVWRIRRDVEPSKVLEFGEEKDLVSMSVTESGRITVIWNRTKISVYSDAGQKLLNTGIQQADEVKFIKHAIEVEDGSFVACNDRQLFRLSVDGKVTDLVDDMGGSYVVRNKNKDVIVADTQGQRALMLDCGKLKLKTTLLSIERDGVECPQHVHFALDSGQLLVSWLNYLDVYSFNERALQSHLAASEQEIRDQRVVERAFLQREVFQSKSYEDLLHVNARIVEENLKRQRSRTSGMHTCTLILYLLDTLLWPPCV